MHFPCVQVGLDLDSATSMLSHPRFILGINVSGQVNFYDGEVFQ